MSSVRQQITIEASSRAVWAALTTEDGVKAWWADEARIDPRVGGRFVIARGEGEERVENRGIFHIIKPTRAIEIHFDGGVLKGATLQFQVGRGDGETKVHAVISGGAAIADEEQRPGIEAFWKDAMLALRAHFEG